jgi:hypothetical protein
MGHCVLLAHNSSSLTPFFLTIGADYCLRCPCGKHAFKLKRRKTQTIDACARPLGKNITHPEILQSKLG